MSVTPMPAPAQPPAFVSFSTDVNPATTTNLLAIMGNAVNNKVPEVHLLLSTNGGSIMHGVNIYNVLRAMPFKLVTHNVGNVDSIGNAIFLAGQDRYACPSATFMFHGVAFNGQPAMDVNITKARLKGLQADEARLVQIVTQHTSMSVQQVRGLYQRGRTMNAGDAMTAGIVHSIQDPVIPAGAAFAAITG